MFNSKSPHLNPRVLATLSDRQQTIIIKVRDEISVTLAEWIATQFIAGHDVGAVYKMLSAAREASKFEPAPAYIARLAYGGQVVQPGDAIKHITRGRLTFVGVTSDGAIKTQEAGEEVRTWAAGYFEGINVELVK